MTRSDNAKSTILAALLLSAVGAGVGTACGAEELPFTMSTVQQGANNTAQVDSANQRVDQAREKFEQARKQLSAAKAVLKAADAEYKAARADRDALALRNTAQQLADASGFAATTLSDSGRQIIMPANGGNRLTPVPTAATPVPVGAPTNVPPAGLDFNGAPAPQDDLKASPQAGSTIVP